MKGTDCRGRIEHREGSQERKQERRRTKAGNKEQHDTRGLGDIGRRFRGIWVSDV